MSTTYTWPHLGGLSTTGLEDGLEQPRLTQFQNFRVDQGVAKRRAGMQRLGRASTAEYLIYDLDGAADYVQIPLVASIHTLKKLWTWETLAVADTYATTNRTLFGVAHAADYSLICYFVVTTGAVEAKVQDSAGAVVTLTSGNTYSTGTVCAIQVVRDGASLKLRVNGILEDSDTMADLDCKAPGGDLYIGRNNTFTGLDGRIAYNRCEQMAKPDQRHGLYRLHDPRNTTVLWDYLMFSDSTGGSERVDDRSRNENHATAVSLGSAATACLTVPTQPCTGIATWRDSQARDRLLIGAGRLLQQQALVK